MRSLLGLRTALVVIAVVAALAVYRRDKFSRIVLPVWVRTYHDVQYGPDRDNVVDVMAPRWPAKTLRPAVVVFHGGAWADGIREDMVDRVCRRYLERGFVVANAEYRKGRITNAVEDAALALRWFAAKAPDYGADPKQIVVTGESAGGHLALMASFRHADKVAAIVNFYGVTDLVPLTGQPFVRAVLPGVGIESAATSLSPITAVRAGLPPILSIHGDADPLIPIEQTRSLTRALQKVGVDASATYIRGGKHGFSRDHQDEAYKAVFDFLEQRGIYRTNPS
jgi:acetyl esterase/lipase